MEKKESKDPDLLQNNQRRGFLKSVVQFFMAAGLVLSYGNFVSILARYLYPAQGRKKEWLFVRELSGIQSGESIAYVAPSGEKIAIARRAMSGQISDFVALSSTCPHLGCQVHWEGADHRFFCPCHNGAFDAEGKAIAGPPAEAKQRLSTYPLKIEGDLLYIEAPMERIDKPANDFSSPDMPSAKTFNAFPGGR